ncbi:MAG: hypothetical protein HYS21_04360 [Deltaproteobacteria bacterium]|nr:hypothetical protein [Deltaproteobacteria bacterium]
MMSSCRYKMIPLIIFLSLSVFFSSVLNSAALENQSPNSNVTAKKERLVARDIGFEVASVRWCGNDRLLIYGDKGLRLLDLKGQWTFVSTKQTDYPLNCSPDGEWVIYVDRKSWRIDRGRVAPPDDEIEGESEWQGFVEDLVRYEVATGKRQVFAIVRDRPNLLDIVSPDGVKAFIGGRHNTPFKMREPKWGMRWLKNEWVHFDPVWFADSSGIVTMVSDEKKNMSLGVEIFGENGWSRDFIPGRDFDIKGRLGDAIAIKNKTISLLTVESYSEVKMGREMGRNRYFFYACDIKRSGLNCKEILEFDLRYTDIRYAVLPDGDIVYKESDDKCIRRFSQSRAKAECISGGPNMGRFYGLSPDGSRIVYERYEKKENKGTSYDLYIMEINQ